MSIRNITTDDLRRMNGQEALILQGCGGDLQEWFDGINELLTEEGILQNGTRFRECLCFHNDADNITCLVFPFSEDVELNVGRLAMWRLGTHSRFGGTWLSDYVPNKLGGFFHGDPQEAEQEVQKPEPAQAEPPQREKPDCELIGQDGKSPRASGKTPKGRLPGFGQPAFLASGIILRSGPRTGARGKRRPSECRS